MRPFIALLMFSMSSAVFAQPSAPCLDGRRGPAQGSLEALVVVSVPRVALLGIAGGVVVRSVDDGLTWRAVAIAPEGQNEGRPAAAAAGDCVVFFVADTMLFSEDSGRTFVTWPLPVEDGVVAAAFVEPERTLLLATESGVARLTLESSGPHLRGFIALEERPIAMASRSDFLAILSENRLLLIQGPDLPRGERREIELPTGFVAISLALLDRDELWVASTTGLFRLDFYGAIRPVLRASWSHADVFLVRGADGPMVVDNGFIRVISFGCTAYSIRRDSSEPLRVARNDRRGSVGGFLPAVELDLLVGMGRRGFVVMLSWPLPRLSARRIRELDNLEQEQARSRRSSWLARNAALNVWTRESHSLSRSWSLSCDDGALSSALEALRARADYELTWNYIVTR